MGKDLFLIVDYGASLTHTHHGSSIAAFVSLAKQHQWSYRVLIPKDSLLAASDLGCSATELLYCLLPSSHRAPFLKGKVNSYYSLSFDKFARFSFKTKQTWVLKLLGEIVARKLIGLIDLLARQSEAGRVTLLFPTACPVAVFTSELLNEKLLKKIPIVKLLCLRLTNTAENRGPFRHIASIPKVIESSKNSSRIRIGFEMKEYASSFNLSSFDYYHSPFPFVRPSSDLPKYTESKIKVTFSFLGFPKTIKGVEEIFRIITQVNQNFSQRIDWIVQLSGSEKNLIERLRLEGNVKLLIGKLSSEVLRENIENSEFLVLPYNVIDYKKNASAMAYQAADHYKPTITLDGSAFAEEIKLFSVGLVCESIEDLIDGIAKTIQDQALSRSFKSNIQVYNSYRVSSNFDFLGIGQK